MQFSMGLALAVVAAGAGCKKVDSGQGSGSAATGGGGSDRAAGSGSAAPAVAPSAPVAWQVPAGARPGDANVDATALGTAVRVHLIERTQKVADNGAREVKLLLVVEGNGAIVADVTDEGLAQDAAPKLKELPANTDLPLAALATPRPFAAADAPVRLDFAGPLLFLAHFASPGEKRDLAIAQDKDSLGVWTMIAASDAHDVAPAWERTGTIKLAPGAVVSAPADASSPAGGGAPAPASASPPAAPASAGGAAAPTAAALDDALAGKRIAPTRIVQRASGPHSQWAAVKGALDPTTASPLTFDVWRVGAAGPAMVTLTPPASPAGSWFDQLSSIEIKDVDGDGVDDAVIAARWSRQLTGKSRHGKLVTTEHVDALYVVGGATLAVGAQHATHYATETNLGDGENPQPAESIAFTTSVAGATLHAETGATTISKSRVKGLLDPAHDPWLTAGDQPIAFH